MDKPAFDSMGDLSMDDGEDLAMDERKPGD